MTQLFRAKEVVEGDNSNLMISMHNTHTHTHTHKHTSIIQIDCDMDAAVLNVTENHGYLVAVVGDSSAQVFLTAESSRCVLGSPNNAISALTTLIGIYFAFNMAFLKPLYPICISLQHFVLQILDTQKVPDVVKLSHSIPRQD